VGVAVGCVAVAVARVARAAEVVGAARARQRTRREAMGWHASAMGRHPFRFRSPRSWRWAAPPRLPSRHRAAAVQRNYGIESPPVVSVAAFAGRHRQHAQQLRAVPRLQLLLERAHHLRQQEPLQWRTPLRVHMHAYRAALCGQPVRPRAAETVRRVRGACMCNA
jgi:hypothetical protein